MQNKHLFRRLTIGILAAAAAAPAFGNLPVIDLSNLVQNIQILEQAKSQIDKLGSILGVNTAQFDQLVNIGGMIGQASQNGAAWSSFSPSSLQQQLSSTPGMQNVNLGSLFNTADNSLNVYMDVPQNQWAQLITTPNSYFSSNLVNSAISVLGASVDLTQPEISYTQYLAQLPSEEINAHRSQIASDLANLALSQWTQAESQRRANLTALAAKAAQNEQAAKSAQNLTQQQAAVAQAQSTTNQTLLESAVQSADANKQIAGQVNAQNQLIQDQIDAARADELQRSSGD